MTKPTTSRRAPAINLAKRPQHAYKNTLKMPPAVFDIPQFKYIRYDPPPPPPLRPGADVAMRLPSRGVSC